MEVSRVEHDGITCEFVPPVDMGNVPLRGMKDAVAVAKLGNSRRTEKERRALDTARDAFEEAVTRPGADVVAVANALLQHSGHIVSLVEPVD